MAAPEKMRRPFPYVTFCMIGLSLATFYVPTLSELFVYDRQAVLEGEVWRIFTAPLVHFSIGHLFWNLLVVSIVGWAVETAGWGRWWIVYGVCSAVAGLVFVFFCPDMARYGGLSGLATAVVAQFCLCNLIMSEKQKKVWMGLVFLVLTKILFECHSHNAIFVSSAQMAFKVMPFAHIIGLLGAFLASFDVACKTRKSFYSAQMP